MKKKNNSFYENITFYILFSFFKFWFLLLFFAFVQFNIWMKSSCVFIQQICPHLYGEETLISDQHQHTLASFLSPPFRFQNTLCIHLMLCLIFVRHQHLNENLSVEVRGRKEYIQTPNVCGTFINLWLCVREHEALFIIVVFTLSRD